MELAKEKETRRQVAERCRIIPLFGRDEMNLIEFPFGPITQSTAKTMEIEHTVFDRALKREVARRLLITGADAFGLPRPVDDQVLVGMKALTYEAGTQEVQFSRYHLCRTIGWEPDGRAYRRLEDSLDRIAGTTLKFKDAWWDKGEQEWKSRTFHLIEQVDLCSKDKLDRMRLKSGRTEQRLCSFVWSDVVWKSFQDGFIRKLDLNMFRRIAQGGRRDVPLRLYRILDKRFHYGIVARMELERLCIGTLGLSPSYGPFEMYRVIERACDWLIECGYLSSMQPQGKRLTRASVILFRKHVPIKGVQNRTAVPPSERPAAESDARAWLHNFDEGSLVALELEALQAGFGSEFVRRMVQEDAATGKAIKNSGRIRTDYLRGYLEFYRSTNRSTGK